MTCLDQACLVCCLGGSDAGSAGKETTDRHSIGRIIRALINYLDTIIRRQTSSGDLHTAGTPAIGHRHLARGERHLITRNGKRFQQGAPDHPLCLFIQICKIIAVSCIKIIGLKIMFGGIICVIRRGGGDLFSHSAAASAIAAASLRICRTSSSSD